MTDLPEVFSKSCLELFERRLEALTNVSSPAARLLEAVRYAVFPAGKRLRPLLLMHFCADLGGNVDAAVPAAISLELLHCASLVHDDLPAMDNDDFRRGRLSCHSAFDEASAILAGDFMLAQALSVVSSGSGATAQQKNQMVVYLADAFMQLCEGQQLDLQPAPADLKLINRLKTGALFAAAFACGGVAAGLDEAVLGTCLEAGRVTGEAFQLIDDYHDSQSDAANRSSSDCRGLESSRVHAEISAIQSKLDALLNVIVEKSAGKNVDSALPLTRFLLGRIFSVIKPEQK